MIFWLMASADPYAQVRRSEADTYVQVPRIYFMELPDDAEVREHKIDVSHNIHGGE